MAQPVGRPSSYNQAIADAICAELAIGKSIRTVCAQEGMPAVETFFRWLRANDQFREQYARAKEEAADAQADELLDLGNEAIESARNYNGPQANALVQAYRLKTDNIKFLMAKMKPKRYGERLDLTSDGKALPQPIFNGLSITTGINHTNLSLEGSPEGSPNRALVPKNPEIVSDEEHHI